MKPSYIVLLEDNNAKLLFLAYNLKTQKQQTINKKDKKMYFQVKNLITAITIPPWDMHLLAKDVQVLKRARDKLLGQCRHDYGYIIKILDDDYKVKEAVVETDGCRVEVQFSAITFKPSKDDVLDFYVIELCKQWIRGTIGEALIIVPEMHFHPDWQFQIEDNCFIDKNSRQRVEKGTKLRCRCFKMLVQMNQMKLVGSFIGDDLGIVE